MPIVLDGEKPRRELAACWRVEVVKGGRGVRLASLCEMSVMDHLPVLPVLTMRVVLFFVFGSSVQASLISVPALVLKSASMTQNFSGMKARISRSRSII